MDSDQLPRAVIGDVAAALDLHDLDFARRQNIGHGLARATRGEHVRVLQHKERVFTRVYFALIDSRELALPGRAVVDGTQIDELCGQASLLYVTSTSTSPRAPHSSRSTMPGQRLMVTRVSSGRRTSGAIRVML